MPPIGQAGRIRMSPLAQAVASSNSGVGNGNAPTMGGGGTDLSSVPTSDAQQGVTPEQVAAAQQAAAQGDQDAIDWLKVMGYGVGALGTGVAGTALYHALKNKKTSQGQETKLGGARSMEEGSRSLTKHAPSVTKLRDEETIPRATRAGYLESPVLQIGQGQPAPVQAPGQQQVLSTPSPNHPVGPTKRQMDEDAAYMTNEALNNRPKVALKKAVAAAKAARMNEAVKAFRRIK